MNTVVIKILQGSAVTQSELGGLPTTNFLQCMCQTLLKMVANRQSFCNNNRAYFFWPSLYIGLIRLPKRQTHE